MADRSVSVYLKANIAGYQAAIAKAQLQTRDFARDAAKSAGQHKQSWDTVGKGMLVTGGVVAAGIGLAVKASMDFEKQMSAVKSVSNASAADMAKLAAAAKKAGADTAYSATEAAQAEAELAKVGISTADILGGALSGSLSLAAAGQIDLANAATISGQAMKIFGLAGTDVGHIADVLAAGANKSAADVDQLGQALQQGGLVAAQTGLSLEDTVGVLSAFADNALTGSDAGTSLKTMLQALNPSSKEAAALMDELGLRAYDAQGNFVGVEKYAGQLKTALSGLSTEQQNAALKTIFGSDATRAAGILYKIGAEGVREYTTAVNDTGAAARTAATQQDNLSGDIEKLKGSVNTLALAFAGPLSDGVRGATQKVTEFTNFVGQMDPATKSVASTVASLGAVVLVVGGAFLTLLPRIVETRAALATLGITAASTKAALAVIGPVGAGLAIGLGLGSIIKEANSLLQAKVPVDDMAKSLDQLGRTGTIGKAGLEVFTIGSGPFRRGADDTSSALKTFAAVANDAFGGGIENKISRFVTAGAPLSAFTDKAKQFDTALAQLAQSGNTESAAASFTWLESAIRKGGGSVEDVAAAFPKYKAAVDAASASQAAATGTGNAFEETVSRLNAKTQKAAVVTKAAQEAADKWRTTLMDLAASFVEPLGAYSSLLETKTAAEKVSAQATADATKSGKDSWSDYAKDVKVSIAEYLTALEDQVKAQQDWETNMLRLSARVSQGTLDELAKMGPEGAPLVAQLVSSSDKELKKLDGLFRARTDTATGAIAEVLTNAGPILAQVARQAGQKTADGYAAKLAAGTVTVAAIAKKYGLSLDKNIPAVKATKFDTPGLDAARARIKALGATIDGLNSKTVSISVATGVANKIAANPRMNRAIGGSVTGPGGPTSDDIPAWLSNGEYVVRASAVQQYGTDFFDQLNTQRLAAGGPVDGSHVQVKGVSTGSITAALAPAVSAISATARSVTASAQASASTAGMPGGGSQASLVALGHWLQGQGARVAEHQAFGGVHPVHVPGSAHYAKPTSRAIDANFGPGGQSPTEMAFFDHLAPAIRDKGFKVLWRVAGHFNHLHAALMANGGLVGGKQGARRPVGPAQVARAVGYASGGRVATSGSSAAAKASAARAATAAREAAQAAKERAATERGNHTEWAFEHKSTVAQLAELAARIKGQRAYSDEWMRLQSKREQILDDAAAKRRESRTEAAAATASIAQNRAEYEFSRKSTAAQIVDLDKRIRGERRFSDEWVTLANQRRDLTLQLRQDEAGVAQNKRSFEFDQKTPAAQIKDLDARIKGEQKYTDQWVTLTNQRHDLTVGLREKEQAARDDLADAAKSIAGNRAEYEFARKTTIAQIADLDRRLAGEQKYTDAWMSLTQQREGLAEQVAEKERTTREEAAKAAEDQARMLATNREKYEFDRKSTDEQIADLTRLIAMEATYTDTWMSLTSQRQALQEQVASTRKQAADEEAKIIADHQAMVGANQNAWIFDHATTEAQIADLDRRIGAEQQYTDAWMGMARQRESLATGLAQADADRAQAEVARAQAEAEAQAQTTAASAKTLAENYNNYTFSKWSSDWQLADLDRRLSAEQAYTDSWIALTQQREQVAEQIRTDQEPARVRAATLTTYSTGKALSVGNTAKFYTNLQRLADRGFGPLASSLLEQSDEEAELVAEQAAAASDSIVSGLAGSLGSAAAQAKQRQVLSDSLKGVTAEQQPTWSLPQLIAGVYGARPAAPQTQQIVVKIGERELDSMMYAVVDGHNVALADGLVYGSG